MKIGFSINEILALATLATGICWVAWKRRVRRLGAVPDKKPLWASFGAELFFVVALMFTCRVAVADWPKVPSGSMEPTLRVGDYLLVDHLAYGPRLPFTNTAITFGKPQRGDVVVFRFPLDVSEFYVKRLIGLPGDTVHFKGGVVAVDGAPFEAEVLNEGEGVGLAPEDRGEWLLRETVAGRSHRIKINPFVMGSRTPPLGMGGQCRTSPADSAANTNVKRDDAPLASDAGASATEWTCRVPPGHYLMLGDNRDNSSDSRVWGFLPEREVYGKAVRVLFNLSDLSRVWKPL